MTTPALVKLRSAYDALLDAAHAVLADAELASGEGIGRVHRDIALIQRIVADHFGYSVILLSAKDRRAPIVKARHVAMGLCRELTICSMKMIGESFGNRDHGTVSWALTCVANRMATEKDYAAEFEALRDQARTAINAPIQKAEGLKS